MEQNVLQDITDLFLLWGLFCEPGNAGFDLFVSSQGSVGSCTVLQTVLSVKQEKGDSRAFAFI